MVEAQESRVDLVFSGELLPNTSPVRARRALAAFFGVADPTAMERFFSGRPIALRRNLTRPVAARLYRQLRSAGIICDLEPVALDNARPSPGARSADTPVSLAAKSAPDPAPPPRGPAGPPPNLFALRPLLAAEAAHNRDSLQLRYLLGLVAALAVVIILVALRLRFPQPPPTPAPGLPLAGAAFDDGRLLLLTERRLLVHGRSGRGLESIPARDFGLVRLQPPLFADSDGSVLLQGIDAAGNRALWRCELTSRRCHAALSVGTAVNAIASANLGSALIAGRPGELLRSDRSSGTLLRAPLPPQAPGRPLLYRDGLLVTPTGDGSLLGVFRPEPDRLGEQIDALLVLPGGDGSAPQGIGDLTFAGEQYWVLFVDAGQAPQLQRFDRRWGYVDTVPLPAEAAPAALVPWGDKLLAIDPSSRSVLRFSAAGQAEAPLASDLLEQAWAQWEQSRQQHQWRRAVEGAALALSGLLLLYSLLQWLEYRDSHRRRLHTALLDPVPHGIFWVPEDPRADTRRWLLSLALLSAPLAVMLALPEDAQRLGVPCLLPAQAGALFASWQLWQGSGGHLGFVSVHGEARLIAVDYDERYCYGPRRRQRLGLGWLELGDVLLPVTPPLLPNLRGASLPPGAATLPALDLLAGLWARRHPWLLAALAIPVGWLLSALAVTLAR